MFDRFFKILSTISTKIASLKYRHIAMWAFVECHRTTEWTKFNTIMLVRFIKRTISIGTDNIRFRHFRLLGTRMVRG